MNEFWSGLGFALAISSIALPLTYCSVQTRAPVARDLHLACIQARGDWSHEKEACSFPATVPEGSK